MQNRRHDSRPNPSAIYLIKEEVKNTFRMIFLKYSAVILQTAYNA